MTTPLQSWPEASLSDPANVPNYLSLGLRAAEKQVVQVFASAAARDAVLAGPNLVNGMVAYLQDTGALTLRFLGAWVNVRDPRTLGVLTFTDEATRNSVLGVPPEGTIAYTQDKNRYWGYTGAAWVLTRALARVGCSAYGTVVTSVPSNTVTPAALNAEVYDSDNFHDLVTNNSRVTVPSGLGGLYNISWHCRNNVTSMGTGYYGVRLNGALLMSRATVPAGAFSSGAGSICRALVAGDYVQLVAFQATGGTIADGIANALESAGDPYSPLLELTFIGPA